MHAQRGEAETAQHMPPPWHRRVTSFRSRRSTLSDAQRRTWDRRWPQLGMEARSDAAESQGVVAPPVDTATWFGRDAPLVLEIGCGTGTSTLAMAKDEPHLDVLAVEVYKRGLAQLLSAVDRDGVTNVRMIRGDALDVLEYLVEPGSLTAVRIYFPDPWPKARHHKRRFVQPDTVALIADRLRVGGILHAATDDSDYAQHIAECGDNEPRLRRATADDPLPVSTQRPTTKYEGKAGDAGRSVTELIWVRT